MEQEDSVVQEPEKQKEAPVEEAPQIVALPTIAAYQKTYAASLGNNDRKAIMLFVEYESNEKRIKMRRELAQISQGKVSDEVCQRAVGTGRKGRYGTFPKWAQTMLSFMQSAR